MTNLITRTPKKPAHYEYIWRNGRHIPVQVGTGEPWRKDDKPPSIKPQYRNGGV